MLQPGHTVISSLGVASLADILMYRKTGATTSTAWTTANRAVFIPFYVEMPTTVYQIAVENGGTLGGNLDVGVYDVTGVRLVSSGTTAQAGISVIQKLNVTDTLLNPGTYFMAMSTDSTTATYIGTGAWSGAGEWWRSFGVQEQLTAFVLPATATFANPASTTTTLPNITLSAVATI